MSAQLSLFGQIHNLSMKATVRSTVELIWNISDSVDGEISELILSLCLESSTLAEFCAKISAVGVDPSNSSIGPLFDSISRMKSCDLSLVAPVGHGGSKSRELSTVSLKRVAEYVEFHRNENITGITPDGVVGGSSKHVRVSDHEVFEMQQLRKTGAVGSVLGVFNTTPVAEEDIEIVKADQEPRFLRGKRVGVLEQPSVSVPLVRDTEGSLQKAAINQAILAGERREIRDAEKKKLVDTNSERVVVPSSRAPVGPKRTTMTIREQRENLPIFHLRESLMKAIIDNQILIVIGETGSGKTTQMTQYLVEDGFGRVACTQPRRVAATSVAKRVAEEMGVVLGEEVGYSIRFDDTSSNQTVIKYLTDGMLLREILVDPMLSRYNVIILDEAHERTVSTDVLFGLLKSAAIKRPDLKLIVTSATLESDKFSKYFFNASIFTIPGRTFPVEITYATEPHDDYLEAALMCVMEIHFQNEIGGDILLFLTGQEEIDTACEILRERMEKLKSVNPPGLLVIPVYSALPSEMQTSIFDPAPKGSRKCVIATNIAEASLTIDGIFYVVDPGFAKIKMYNPKAGMDSLIVAPISQASARQRAGRAGRTAPGKCFRLYTEHAMEREMLPTNVPEIQRTNLSNVVLMLKAMGIEDLLGFDFMDKPSQHTLISALETLWLLNALDDDGNLTKLGRRMAEFPMAPEESKMLLASVDLGCADDVITIVAMLSVQTIFHRPRGPEQKDADERKRRFHSPDGDHITLLEVYRHWTRNNKGTKWCFDNYIIERSLKRAADVRKQLIGILEKFKLEIHSAGPHYDKIRKAICAGYFHNACKRDHTEGYKILRDDQQVFIHPSSVLHQKSPEYCIYHELVQTSREYIRDLCIIEPHWLIEIAPNLFSKSNDTISKAKRGEKIKPLYNKFEDEAVWRLSKRFGK